MNGWAEVRADVNNANVLWTACKVEGILVAVQTNVEFLDTF